MFKNKPTKKDMKSLKLNFLRFWSVIFKRTEIVPVKSKLCKMVLCSSKECNQSKSKLMRRTISSVKMMDLMTCFSTMELQTSSWPPQTWIHLLSNQIYQWIICRRIWEWWTLTHTSNQFIKLNLNNWTSSSSLLPTNKTFHTSTTSIPNLLYLFIMILNLD